MGLERRAVQRGLRRGSPGEGARVGGGRAGTDGRQGGRLGRGGRGQRALVESWRLRG